jgi:hypothetical protein
LSNAKEKRRIDPSKKKKKQAFWIWLEASEYVRKLQSRENLPSGGVAGMCLCFLDRVTSSVNYPCVLTRIILTHMQRTIKYWDVLYAPVADIHTPFAWFISHQPTVFFSQNKPATSIFLSQQINTSHQPPAKRTGCQ